MFRRERETELRRFKRFSYGPLGFRLVVSAVAVMVGLFLVVTYLSVLAGDDNDHAVSFYIGLGLIALGVVSFFVYRWMAKRGI